MCVLILRSEEGEFACSDFAFGNRTRPVCLTFFPYGWVLPWDMVDNSTRPCKRSSGWFSSHSTGSGMVPDPDGPHACHCFHLHQAIPCQITERLLMSLTLTCSSVAPAAKDSTRLRVLTTVGGFCQLPSLECVAGSVAPRVCPLVLAAARAPLGVIREDAQSDSSLATIPGEPAAVELVGKWPRFDEPMPLFHVGASDSSAQ